MAVGNTVVLKASEICPGTHRLIAECLRDAGMPPGVLNVITNAPEDAPALIEMLIGHPAVRRVNFTGSTRVGRIIAQVAAKYKSRFPNVKLFTIDRNFGGWKQAQANHFNDGALFDQIFEAAKR